MPYGKFLRHLQYEKRYSTHTLTAYGNDLKQFFYFIESTYQVKEVRDITHFFIRSWIVSLMEQKIDSRSVNRKISTLKSLYKFLLREKAVEHNPILKITSPKVSKKLPVFVEQKDMNKLLDGVDFKEGFPGLRDKLVINLFYKTGMRLSELINLTDKDVDIHSLTVKVLGKRNKERVIPFATSLVTILEKYLTIRNREIEMKEHGNLFVTANGEICYPMMIYRTVRKYLDEFTSLEKRSPHVLRHTYATHLLNKGADLNAVKDLMGHASLAATQVYTHNSIETLKKAFDQAHPKA